MDVPRGWVLSSAGGRTVVLGVFGRGSARGSLQVRRWRADALFVERAYGIGIILLFASKHSYCERVLENAV